MAQNNFDTNGNNKDRFEPQYISRIRFSNIEQNMNMGFKFWKGLLCIEINKVEMQEGGGLNFERLNAAYVSPLKAYMLANLLDEFEKDKKHGPVGINLGSGEVQKCITFAHTSKADLCYICDLTPAGAKEKEAVYEFATDYYYALEYSDWDKVKCDKKYFNNLEITVIKNTLRQFADAMLGANGYGVMDFARFYNTHIENNFNMLFNKLGIERQSSNGGYNSNRGSSRDSFFNRNGAAAEGSVSMKSTHREVDDLDDMLDDD